MIVQALIYIDQELIAETYLPPFQQLPGVLVWQDQVHVLFETSKQPNGSQTGKYVRSTAFKVADQYVAEPRQHKEVESDGTQEATEVSTKKQKEASTATGRRTKNKGVSKVPGKRKRA